MENITEIMGNRFKDQALLFMCRIAGRWEQKWKSALGLRYEEESEEKLLFGG